MNRKKSLSLLMLGAIVIGSRAGAQQIGPATVAEQYLLAAANQERAALGLPALRRDRLLAQAAASHARAMAAHGSISHQFPGESELSLRGAREGVRFSTISENVGEAPSAVVIHDMWMRSPGHRANLLDATVDAAGISVVERRGQLYAVEDFAATVQPLTIEQQEASVAALLSQAGIHTLNPSERTIDAARRTCSMPSGYAGEAQPSFVMRFTSDRLSALPSQLTERIASGKYRQAAVGACVPKDKGPFTDFTVAVLLYP